MVCNVEKGMRPVCACIAHVARSDSEMPGRSMRVPRLCEPDLDDVEDLLDVRAPDVYAKDAFVRAIPDKDAGAVPTAQQWHVL